MAQKQYSFDFVLNAVLNGGFSSTFTRAQQEFIRLGNEIKNLQAIQRDIAAYQKQDAAVQNTTNKLRNLEKQYELVKKQISETTGSTTALEREKLKLEQRIGTTSNALEKQTAKLEETKGRLEEAGVSTDDLSAKDAELTEKIKELTEEQKRAAEGAGEFGNKAVQAIDAVGTALAAAGIAEAMKRIGEAFMECVGAAADFEKAMSAVEAISGANSSEMAALSAEAKELGATTVFTAQQSADAMQYMAMAGWSAEEMLSGMRGMTTLAAAAGEDLAQVSDIVTDNLTAFGLSASDTAHFADVLAAAAANSNTNISIMGETFKNSAAVAGALGYSIEDVAVMTGLMANNAVKGSRAGTALRNIFNGLLSGVTLTAEAFGELDYSAVNSDGSMKGLMETVKDLRDYFSQMTEAEKVNNAMNIAGMRGYNGLLAILNATDEDFQSLYDSINNCSGAAERMAATKMDNLSGDVTLLNDAFDALKMTIGEEFSSELRGLAQAGTDALNWINSLAQDVPGLASGVIAAGGALITMTTAVVGVSAAIKVLKALDLASVFTGPVGAIMLGVTAVAGLTAALIGMNEAAKNNLDESWQLTAASREQYEQLQDLRAEYDRLCEAQQETTAEGVLLKRQIEELTAEYEAGKQTLEEYTAAHDSLIQSYQEMASAHASAYASINAEEAGTQSLIAKLGELSVTSESAAQNQDAILAVVNALNDAMPGLALTYDDVASGQEGLITSLFEMAQAEAQAKRVAEEWLEYTDRLAKQDVLKETMEADAEQARLAAEDYATAMQAFQDAMRMYGSDPTGFGMYFGTRDEAAAVDAAREQLDLYNAALAESTAVYEANEAAIASLEAKLGDYTAARLESAGITSEEMAAIGELRDELYTLAEAYQDVYDAALESFQGQFGLFDVAQADANATVQAAQNALNTQLSFWQNYAENIAVLKEVSAEDLGVTQESYDALMEYVRNGTPEAAGLAASMVQEITSGNQEAVADLANTLAEISESQKQAAEETAAWVTGLEADADELVAYIKARIEELDLSEEAAAKAQATIDAYIAAARSRVGEVQAAFAEIAAAAAAGLSEVASGSSGGSSGSGTGGYASGTDNAPPGWAWVGENGPELMRMHGGEQILPSDVSRQVVEEYNTYNRYSAAQWPQGQSAYDTVRTEITGAGNIIGYANGTDNAAPGWNVVGEEGAELMRTHSGGQILPGSTFQQAAEDYNDYKNYSAAQVVQQTRPLEVTRNQTTETNNNTNMMNLHFHIESGAPPETVDALRSYVQSGELDNRIREVMADADRDRRRRLFV